MRDVRHLYDTPAEPPPAWLLVLMGVLATPVAGGVIWGLMWSGIVLTMWIEAI